LAILGYAEYLRRERQAAVRVAAPVLRSRVVDEPDPQLELIFR